MMIVKSCRHTGTAEIGEMWTFFALLAFCEEYRNQQPKRQTGTVKCLQAFNGGRRRGSWTISR